VQPLARPGFGIARAPRLPSACIIGAGSSGIAAAKALQDRGIPFDCFEKSDRVGGNWVFGNKNGMAAAYRNLHINTSRERMQYADFPMPSSYPDFPHHAQIAAYFDAYVDRFGLRAKIAFETAVARAERASDGVWDVTLGDGARRRYDMLIVANGHHWDPRWPEPRFPGRFDGLEMHAHAYVDSKRFHDQNVVVVGMGNSAMDIAVETSYAARRVFLAARRGAYVIPKYLFGRPLDQIATDPRIPFRVKQAMTELTLRFAVGKMERYGLPKPDHRLLEAHPTVSNEALSRIAHGAIVPKPNVAELLGDRVRFTDGSEEPADAIVYCTGYRITFPFFDPAFFSAPDNAVRLFRNVFAPQIPNLAFVGLAQPLGAIMPIAEAQARWIGDYLTGRYALPPPAAMEADIDRTLARMQRRYVASKRHTIQIDFDSYLYELGKETRAGARCATGAPPFPPRATIEEPALAR
jgi:cation diffusion facilitator CzcD-associated flavoprotein CzcO